LKEGKYGLAKSGNVIRHVGARSILHLCESAFKLGMVFIASVKLSLDLSTSAEYDSNLQQG
jgi:hypothetical protein